MDTSEGQSLLSDFNETAIRHGFIRKVYGILGFQLAITAGVGAWIMKEGEHMKRANPTAVMGMMVGSIVASLGIMLVFICCPDTMRKTPQNYILLIIFTLAESVMVGFISIQYTMSSVVMCLGITAAVVLALTLFACQTSIDFTGMGAYLFCAVMVLMGFGFFIWIGSMMGMSHQTLYSMQMVYAGAGALIFSMYIVYDTQLIVGGKHAKYQFSIDDYCMAAISLYIDIIQLFLMLLQLLGSRR